MSAARQGFTLIEMLVVIAVISILAAVGLPKIQATRMKGIKASMVADLRNLVAAQEGFLSVYGDYAGSITSGASQSGSPGKLSYVVSSGNKLTLSWKNPKGTGGPGWSATVTNPKIVKASFKTCGIFIGSPTTYSRSEWN